jgi:hypothetical protein
MKHDPVSRRPVLIPEQYRPGSRRKERKRKRVPIYRCYRKSHHSRLRTEQFRNCWSLSSLLVWNLNCSVWAKANLTFQNVVVSKTNTDKADRFVRLGRFPEFFQGEGFDDYQHVIKTLRYVPDQ